jgi:hypothetical protein
MSKAILTAVRDQLGHPGNTYVNIKQQPNDAADAARLHGQIRDKATAQAQAEFERATVQRMGAGNCLKVVSSAYEFGISALTHRIVAMVDINGQQFRIECNADETQGRVADQVAEALKDVIIRELFDGKSGQPKRGKWR